MLQGLGVLAIILGVFLVSLRRGHGELDARALTFTTLVLANLGLILVNRSWTRSVIYRLKARNDALWWVLMGSLIILTVVLYVPYLRTVFRFSVLHPIDLAVCFVASVTSIVWFELWKWRRATARSNCQGRSRLCGC